MKAGLVSSAQLNRAYAGFRRSQPVGGLGFLNRAGWRGQTFHQHVFRVGKQRPDGPLSPEQEAGYTAVNVHRPWILTDPRQSCASPTPTMSARPRTWQGKAVIVSQRTQAELRAAVMGANMSCVDGMQATNSSAGVRVVGRAGFTGSSGAFRRPAAMPSRMGGAHGAAVLRSLRAVPMGTGSGLEQRGSGNGTMVGSQTVGRANIVPALVEDGSLTTGVGIFLRAEYSGSEETATADLRCGAIHSTGRGNFWAAEPRVIEGVLRTSRMVVVVKREYPGYETFEEYGSLAVPPAALDVDDASTWLLLVTLSVSVRSSRAFEQVTVVDAYWAD